MKRIFFATILLRLAFGLEQDGYIAREELDNYTVYLMRK